MVRGYDLALAHPAVGQRALESQVQGLNHALDTAELAGLEALPQRVEVMDCDAGLVRAFLEKHAKL